MSTKLRGDKGPVPPLRALKLRLAEEREWAFELVNQQHPTTGQPLTNAECRAEIHERLGISLGSDGAYSDFRSWQLRQRLHDRLNQIAEDDEQHLTEQFPGLTREQLREMTIKRSYATADLLQDPTFTLNLIRVDQAETSGRFRAEMEAKKHELATQAEARQAAEHQLNREKFELEAAEMMLNEALRLTAQGIAASNLSQADKIAAMRKAAFSDVDALQQSGKIQIPRA